jgi:DUF1680 family protein
MNNFDSWRSRFDIRHSIGAFLRIWLTTGIATFTVATVGAERGELPFQSLPFAQYHLEGLLGLRVRRNVENWLLRAPEANPGMIEMFLRRDRPPPPDLVPWAGEFVGKYLISAIQALRLDDRPDLRERVADVVRKLVTSQARDGYLGPFPLNVRLQTSGDWWGHYHCLLALLMWHEATGDPAALKACQRAADLACGTFPSFRHRLPEMESPEMGMAIIHALGWLHRETSEARYLELMREIEMDWETAGDYLRTGLGGIEFFQTPRPRWESLHNLQGLVELYRITGEQPYKTAFLHHWRSLWRRDRRNTGGFSSDGQATGNPYAGSPIETCGTVAWMALTVDMLRMTGAPVAADELELSTFNAAAGAQHPSGCWWTSSTPMNGIREASAQTLVSHARAGTPELNCCAVNGPRAIGILTEWAVMRTEDGLVVNYYGPGTFQGKLADNTPIALQMETDYPLTGKIQIRVEPFASRRFDLKLRIPAWSQTSTVRLNNSIVTNVVTGRYLEITRTWKSGDRITLDLDMRLRVIRGEGETTGRVSVYRGPLLLAYDQRHNEFDEEAVPPLDLRQLREAKRVSMRQRDEKDSLQPWILLEIPGKDGRRLRLCDFASAGAAGTRYRSWLLALDPP